MLAASLHFLVERYLHPKIHASCLPGTKLDEETDFGAGVEAALPSQLSTACSQHQNHHDGAVGGSIYPTE